MGKARAQTSQTIPLDIVGSTSFGRYPKVSVEQTFNMLIVDSFLANFAGYQFRAIMGESGRGIYASTRANLMFAVADNKFYQIGPNLVPIIRGTLNTTSGDVFMAEDLQGNIAVCDKVNLWYYNYTSNQFTLALKAAMTPLGFTPTYVAFHNGRFIVTNTAGGSWQLSDLSANQYFPQTAQFDGSFQTKPDAPIAVVPLPGRANNILIMGSNVAEPWVDLGLALFPYQKITTFNIDFGCVNPATLATLENLAVWLGRNQDSGPVILFSNGQDVKQISNDGINYKLATLQFPTESYGFLFKQDGHLLYVLTFFNPVDNFSICFDFLTQKFFTLTDEQMNYFIAKKAVFFNGTYYFISINDGNLYEINSAFTNYQYQTVTEEIPRVRVTKTYRTPGGQPFVVNTSAFPLEQGDDTQNTTIMQEWLITEGGNQLITEDRSYLFTTEYPDTNPYQPRVDLAISIDGGDTFGNFSGMLMNPVGKRKNRFVYYNLGYCNEITHQFRFYGLSRFVMTDGEMSIYG